MSKFLATKWFRASGLVFLALFVFACGAPVDSDVQVFQRGASTLRGRAFEFSANEIALTLDDGPSVWTRGLARYLELKKVPATFFVTFRNGSNGIDTSFGRETVRAVCSSKLLDVGNHSDFHSTTSRAWTDMSKVHDFLANNCPKDWFFYRSPGGNWKAADSDVLNAVEDADGRSLRTTYIGPVYWDYGGDAPRADWHVECQKNPSWCRDSYRDEIVAAQRGGIVLAHDIHSSTIEMLLGKNWKALIENPEAEDLQDGLISRMEQLGYKWVSLAQNENIIASLLGRLPF